jgi:hypothetical protein
MGGERMVNAIAPSKAKWPYQVPSHIKKKFDSLGEDYTLNDVINICREIINLYEQGNGMEETWEGIKVPDLMMSTVTFYNKFKRYI